MQAFRRVRRVKGKPSMVVMHTVKGKGMRHVENTAASHSVSFSLEEVEKLLFDLNCQIDEIRETLAQLKEKH
jgi:transketolase